MSERFSHRIETGTESLVEHGPEMSEPHELTPVQMLTTIKSGLRVGNRQMGRMFGVKGNELSQWLAGEIPIEKTSEISDSYRAYRHLKDAFKEGRLPVVIRRTAPLFSGERALDFILDGRISEVTEAYFPSGGGDIYVEADNIELRRLTRSK